MSITLFSMDSCPFCVKAIQMFKDEIESGEVVVKPASHANNKYKGFPAFESSRGNHVGLPPSKEHVLQKLAGGKRVVREHFRMGGRCGKRVVREHFRMGGERGVVREHFRMGRGGGCDSRNVNKNQKHSDDYIGVL